jgi:hypothetical protein
MKVLEGVRGMREPVAHRAFRAALKRNFDEARIAAVKAAEQVHRIGHVTARMRACAIEQ